MSRTGDGLRTPSLRGRVTVMAVLLIGVLLVVLALVTDLVVGSRLEGQLRQRLADRATVATALADQVDARDLARRLEGDGVSVVVRTSSGQVYAEGPLGGAGTDGGQAAPEGANTPGAGAPTGGPGKPPKAPDQAKKQIVQSGDRLTLITNLQGGESVTLLADAADVHRTQAQVRLALGIAALAVLLAVVVLVPLVVRRALRPLEQMTGVARSITSGDRTRRLRPERPTTDLGRTASAFDDAFDAVVGAESRAVGSEERLRGFLSDAAHELRTPISGVQAAAEHVLRDDPPRAEREQALLGLVRETRRAGRLVEDLLTMARIDQGVSLDRADVDLVALAHDVVDRYAVAHPGATLEVTGRPGPLVVRADADRLVQVLGNLLDNALHAGPGGPVRLETWADADADADGGTGRAGIDVVDAGPGVPAADAERVFERLVRLDTARTRHRGGAGLGLPIARGLAEAHGGTLALVDDGAPGARFRLALPTGLGPAAESGA